VAAFELQSVIPGVAQVLPIVPFPLMILALVLVSTDRLRGLADRWPRLRGILVADAPAAIGTVFERE
jgi:hypothetical protein